MLPGLVDDPLDSQLWAHRNIDVLDLGKKEVLLLTGEDLLEEVHWTVLQSGKKNLTYREL